MEIYKERTSIETFRFMAMKDFSEENVTLPIDKIVAELIKEYSSRHKLLQ
jgi:hypothetical protein